MDRVAAEESLRRAGLRATAGRVAVLEALTTIPHSDADTVLRAVRDSLPTTSIQSVHNILGDLTTSGLLRRIEPAGSPALYERRINDNHHHVVCSRCGAIADVDCVVGEAPCLNPQEAAGYAVDTAEITFWGICPACQVASSAQTPARTR